MSDNATLIFGRHPVAEAIRSGAAIDKVYLQSGTKGPFEQEIRQLCKDADVQLQYVPKERLNKLTQGNHQGVIAVFALTRNYTIEEVLAIAEEKGEAPLLLILDSITDVRNFGAIARTAELFGVHGLIIPQGGAARVNPDAMKSSAGALATLPVCREKSLFTAIEALQMSNIRVLATEMKADFAVHEMALDIPTAFILGSEGKGIHPKMAKIADERCYIPQKGKLDSLNVSVAAGIVLYEALRQRNFR